MGIKDSNAFISITFASIEIYEPSHELCVLLSLSIDASQYSFLGFLSYKVSLEYLAGNSPIVQQRTLTHSLYLYSSLSPPPSF